MSFAELVVGKPRTVVARLVDQEGNPQELAPTPPDWSTTAPVSILSSSVANPTTITTDGAHGLTSGRYVEIAGHAGSTPAINGVHQVTVTGAATFTIPVNVTVGGTGGTLVRYCIRLLPLAPDFLSCLVEPLAPGEDVINFLGFAPHDGPGPGSPDEITVSQPVEVLPASRLAFFRYDPDKLAAVGPEITVLRIDDSDDTPQIVAVPVTAAGGVAMPISGTTSVPPVSNIAWLNVDGDVIIQIDNGLTTLGPQSVILRSPGDEVITITALNALGAAISGELDVRTLAVTAVSLELQA